MNKAQQAFEAYAAGHDTMSDEWQDKGADDFFIAGHNIGTGQAYIELSKKMKVFETRIDNLEKVNSSLRKLLSDSENLREAGK